MKRIVKGVTYNTDTSVRLAESRWQGIQGEKYFGTLYQTRGGAFFVDSEITRERWNELERESQTEVVHEFSPKSPDQAQKWMIAGEVEVFHYPFGENPPEATAESGLGATIYIRVPASLKKRVDDAARAENVSANIWAMRCLEQCLKAKKTEQSAVSVSSPEAKAVRRI